MTVEQGPIEEVYLSGGDFWHIRGDEVVFHWEETSIYYEWGYATFRPLSWRQVRIGAKSAGFHKPRRPRSRR